LLAVLGFAATYSLRHQVRQNLPAHGKNASESLATQGAIVATRKCWNELEETAVNMLPAVAAMRRPNPFATLSTMAAFSVKRL
jgi:hypothetical protein